MKDKCSKFNSCGAPLCPLDEESLKYGIFYPDEEICTKRPFPLWIKAQRKITKRCKDKDKYFSYEMLNRLSQVRIGTIGLDPDRDEKPQLKRWLRTHPKREKRKLTEEKKRKLREFLQKAREKKRGYSPKIKWQ